MTAPTCTHWDGPQARMCGATHGVRRYVNTTACPQHSPAGLAGRGKPDNPSDAKTARRAA